MRPVRGSTPSDIADPPRWDPAGARSPRDDLGDGFLAFVPLYMDLGMAGAGLVLGLFSGIVVLIRSRARIPDRVGPGRATRISLVLSTIGLATIGLRREPIGLVVGAAVLGVGVALFTPALFTLAVEDVPSRSAAP